MRRFDKLGFAALLAGTAFIAYPVAAQDSTTEIKPPIVDPGAADKSARQLAPGATKKMDNEQSARDNAPGQQAIEGEVDSAAEAAPGQMKNDDTAEADDPATSPNENAATEAAPGQLQKSGEVGSATEAAPGQLQQSGEVDSAAEAAPGQVKGDTAQADDPGVSGETTASINLSETQEVEIRSVIQETRVEPVEDLHVEIEIGVRVPQTIELHPLPPRIVEIVPDYRDYDYFVLADGRIVIVEPVTYEVVYVIVA